MFNVGSVFFGANTNNGGGGGGVTTVLANQGASIDPGSLPTAPVVQWGDGVDGSASRVIGTRFMDLQRGEMKFLNVGDPAFGFNGLKFQEAAGRIYGTTPFMTFYNPTGGEIGRVNFGDSGGVFLGPYVAENDNKSGQIGIGRNVFRGFITGGSNIGIGADVMSDSPTVGANNIGIGNESMAGLLVSGSQNVGVGQNALFNIQGAGNVAVGAGTGQGAGQANNNVFVGRNVGYGGAASFSNADGNVFVGGQSLVFPTGPWGEFNTFVGSFINYGNRTGSYNMLFGWGHNFDNTRNSSVFGYAFTSNLSNVAFFGNPDQNMIIGGARSGQTDSGVKMQVIGDISTLDPDTGLSGSGWEFGTWQPGAVVMDAANFISVKIGGVAYKLLVAA